MSYHSCYFMLMASNLAKGYFAMNRKLRWGVLSTGNIATLMVQDLLRSQNSDVVAVASRSKSKADAFAHKFGISNSFGSYQALCDCKEVDIVYIGTPHSEHFENCMMALYANKHVLCEKPITLTVEQATECYSLAKQKNLFLMEALWMRFFPVIKKVKGLIDSESLGRAKKFSANFCIHIPFDPAHRLYDKSLGGGALMDVGIYPLTLSQILFGQPDTIKGTCDIGSTGVDFSNVIESTYVNGPTCAIRSSIVNGEPNIARIECEQGTINIGDCFFCPTNAIIEKEGCASEEISHYHDTNGYEFEIQEVENCISQGRIESELWTANDSILNMMLMQGLRHQWGIIYADELF